MAAGDAADPSETFRFVQGVDDGVFDLALGATREFGSELQLELADAGFACLKPLLEVSQFVSCWFHD